MVILLVLSLSALVMILALILFYVFYPAVSGIAWSSAAAKKKLQLPTRYALTFEPTPIWEIEKEQTNKIAPPLLSVVVPAYNEESRLPGMLQSAFNYLQTVETCPALSDLRKAIDRRRQVLQRKKGDEATANQPSSTDTTGSFEVNSQVEWIIVSDGSTDATEQVYRDFAMQTALRNKLTDGSHPHSWRLLILPQNSGKGAAVKAGMLAARGRYCLMVDADGATEFDNLQRLTDVVQTASNDTEPVNCVWGSRAHLQDTQRRGMVREVLMKGFHFFVRFLVCTNSTYVKDTQCGFKIFEQPAAHRLFHNLHIRGWAFDTELLVLVARLKQLRVAEVPVNWHEVDGSKLSTSPFQLACVSLSMLRDMICVRLCYELGVWKVDDDGLTCSGNKSKSE